MHDCKRCAAGFHMLFQVFAQCLQYSRTGADGRLGKLAARRFGRIGNPARDMARWHMLRS